MCLGKQVHDHYQWYKVIFTSALILLSPKHRCCRYAAALDWTEGNWCCNIWMTSGNSGSRQPNSLRKKRVGEWVLHFCCTVGGEIGLILYVAGWQTCTITENISNTWRLKWNKCPSRNCYRENGFHYCVIALKQWAQRSGRSLRLWMPVCVRAFLSVRTTRFDHFHWCWGSLTERLVVLWGFWVSDDLQNPAAGILPLSHRNHAANIIKKVYIHTNFI